MPRKPRGAVEVYLYCTPRTLYLRLRPGTHCKGGCVGTTDGLDGCGKSRPHWDSIPGPSRRSESLYRPGYPGRYSGQRPVSSLPELQFSPVSTIPPLLHTHSPIYHPRCIMFFLPVLQFSPVSTIPPLLHTHLSIYHPRCIMFFLPVLQFSPVSIIPPLLHTHSSIYHPRCIMFFSQYFSFPLSVPFHHNNRYSNAAVTRKSKKQSLQTFQTAVLLLCVVALDGSVLTFSTLNLRRSAKHMK